MGVATSPVVEETSYRVDHHVAAGHQVVALWDDLNQPP